MILCKPERTEGVYPEDSFRLKHLCAVGASQSRLTPLRVSLSSDLATASQYSLRTSTLRLHSVSHELYSSAYPSHLIR